MVTREETKSEENLIKLPQKSQSMRVESVSSSQKDQEADFSRAKWVVLTTPIINKNSTQQKPQSPKGVLDLNKRKM